VPATEELNEEMTDVNVTKELETTTNQQNQEVEVFPDPKGQGTNMIQDVFDESTYKQINESSVNKQIVEQQLFNKEPEPTNA